MTKLNPIGSYPFKIDAYLTDFCGNATLSMLGRFMLQVATIHAEERGFGYSYMTHNDRAWVLSRMSIELFDYPKSDETFILSTWVQDVNRLFTIREFSFKKTNGKEFGYAKTSWASIDVETRKPTNILDLESMNSIIVKTEPCLIKDATKLKSINGEQSIEKFKIKYSDIDINGHLNSIKYIEHLIDVFPLDLFQTKQIERIDLNYIAEGKFGNDIDIFQIKNENELVFDLDMKCNNETICLSKIRWK